MNIMYCSAKHTYISSSQVKKPFSVKKSTSVIFIRTHVPRILAWKSKADGNGYFKRSLPRA